MQIQTNPTKFKRGLVVGKFYPPHKGHKYLIDAALGQAKNVDVVVCDLPGQKIPAELRARWIKEIHPKASVRVVMDIEKNDDSYAWAEYTKAFLGYTPDAVFTSEDYGDQYSKFLGAVHVKVDKQRKTVPISATLVRSDPLKYSAYLEPNVRSHFIKRVCVVGAESTGTTTLVKALAEHYKTNWVPEFGRLYAEAKLPSLNYSNWESREFTYIAVTQNELEDKLAEITPEILICDTNSFATSLWHERYMGFMNEELKKLWENRKYDLYILTDSDIPFVQDGTRDGEHIRHNMNERFKEELTRQKIPWLLVAGPHKERLKKAILACDEVLRSKDW